MADKASTPPPPVTPLEPTRLTGTCLSFPSFWPGEMASDAGVWAALPRPGRSLSEPPTPDVLCSYTSRHMRDRYRRELAGPACQQGYRQEEAAGLRSFIAKREDRKKESHPLRMPPGLQLAERGDRQGEAQASLPRHRDPRFTQRGAGCCQAPSWSQGQPPQRSE